MKRAQYSDKQIISLTGHRSHASLYIYDHIHDNEKMKMGYTLGYALLNPNTIPVVSKENISIAPKRAKCTLPEVQKTPALPSPPLKRKPTATVSSPAEMINTEENREHCILLPKNTSKPAKPTIDLFLSEINSSPDDPPVGTSDQSPPPNNM